MRAFYQRIRARRGYGIAIVAAARKLACLFWCLLDPRRELRPPAAVADRQEAAQARAQRRRPAIQQRRHRGLDDQPRRCAKPSASSPTRPRPPTCEWSATGKPQPRRRRLGASVTPGRASSKALEGQSRAADSRAPNACASTRHRLAPATQPNAIHRRRPPRREPHLRKYRPPPRKSDLPADEPGSPEAICAPRRAARDQQNPRKAGRKPP